MTHPQLMVTRSPAGYRWLRLARPERRNALDVSLMLAVRDALSAEPEAPVLLGSTDPRVFCAGADLTISDADRAVISDLIYDCCETMITRPGPVIAVVTGAAVGGGAQLAAASDLRIAGPGARLRWIGPPGPDLAVGAWLLPDLAGRGVAMDLVLTGRWVEAAEALALGLVNRIENDPEQAAEQLAADLAERRTQGIQEGQGGRGTQGGQGSQGGQGGQGGGAGAKAVMAAGGLLDRLRAEREVNRSAWARVIGTKPARGDGTKPARGDGTKPARHEGLCGLERDGLAAAPARGGRSGLVRRGTRR
jgi:enoyl-CoA hydratase/carnithine racemase